MALSKMILISINYSLTLMTMHVPIQNGIDFPRVLLTLMDVPTLYLISKIFYWPFQGGASFVDHFCYLCSMFVMRSCLFIAAF